MSNETVHHENPDGDEGLWTPGTNPDPKIKKSFAAAAKQIMEMTKQPPRQHRYAVYRIGVDRVLDAIRILMTPKDATLAYTVRWTKCPWPEGARCVNIREDFYSRSFLLTMEHESFDEVPEGMSFPILNDPGYPECEIVKLAGTNPLYPIDAAEFAGFKKTVEVMPGGGRCITFVEHQAE